MFKKKTFGCYLSSIKKTKTVSLFIKCIPDQTLPSRRYACALSIILKMWKV